MLAKFLKENNLYGKQFFNVIQWTKVFWALKIIQFVLVGGTGALIQLGTTFILTQFIWGVELYYLGYSFGLGLNLIYNFILHTKFTFKSKKNHKKRFIVFTIYSLTLTLAQYLTVRGLVNYFGEKWYMVVIASAIIVCATISFFLYKFWLFKE